MPRVLILEDDLRTAEEVAKSLEAVGCICVLEGNGTRALDTVQRERFDLIILDVMLPGTSGFEICRRIRRDPHLFTMPVLILSAMGAEEEILHGLAQGADDYVTKPFEMSNLVRRVEALLRTSADNQAIDPLTELPGASASKRVLQQKISNLERFSLAYGELVQLREFSHHFGTDARSKAIRHLARALVQVGSRLDQDQFMVGHMGGGHFVCVLPPQVAEEYCARVRQGWETHLQRFYASIGQERAYAAATEGPPSAAKTPLLDLLFCITVHDRRDSSTPQQLFETLSRIRGKALATSEGGVFCDQRA